MEFNMNYNPDKSSNLKVLDFRNEGLALFEEELENEANLSQYKQFFNADEHLYDTVPHEDELNELDVSGKKTRNNLRAKKRKKSKYEVEILEAYFEKDPEWSRHTVKLLKPLLNLSVDQIYKWGYDRKHLIEKRKSNIPQKSIIKRSKTMKKNIATNLASENLLSQFPLCSYDQSKWSNLLLNEQNSEINHQEKPNSKMNYFDLCKSNANLKEHKDLEILPVFIEDKNYFGTLSEHFEIQSWNECESLFNSQDSDFQYENLT